MKALLIKLMIIPAALLFIALGCDGGDDDKFSNNMNNETTSLMAPNLYSVTLENGSVTLQWEPKNSESVLVGFRIGRNSGEGWGNISEAGAGIDSYIDDTVEQGMTYNYRIIAYNNSVESDPSNEMSVDVPYEVITLAVPVWLQGNWDGSTDWIITADNVTNPSVSLDVKSNNETYAAYPQICYVEYSSSSTSYQISYNGSVIYSFSNPGGTNDPASITVTINGSASETLNRM